MLLLDECPKGLAHLCRLQRAETKRPAAAELLAERMGDAALLKDLLVMLGSLVSAPALERSIKPVAPIVHWPDRHTIGNRTRLRWQVAGGH